MSFDQKLSQAAELARAGRFDEAELACRLLLRSKPKNFDALQLLGLAQAQLGRPTEAVDTLQKALHKDRQHAGVRNNLGNALMSLGRFEEARRSFEQATELAPTSPDAYVGLGVSLMRLGRLTEAVSALERSLRWGPDRPEAMDALGQCLLKQGELRRAMKHQLAAAQASPLLPSAFVNLFNTLMFMHATDDARRVAEAGVSELPEGSAEAVELQIGLAKLAWLEGRLGDVGTALAASSSALSALDDYDNGANLRVFHRYLGGLLTFRAHYRGPAYSGSPNKALFFVSESHGFGPSETVVYLDGEPRRVLSSLITGCKVFHLARGEHNEYRASAQAILRAIPEGHPVVFGFGEIDCRLDEGIGKAHRTKGVDYRATMPGLVQGYVDFLAEAASACGHRLILYGVPAPNPTVLAGRSAEDRDLLVDVIRSFNDELRRACEARELLLLDVHAYTATVEGVADGTKHVDEVHVHPETVRALLPPPRRT